MRLARFAHVAVVSLGLFAVAATGGAIDSPRQIAFFGEHEGGLHLLNYATGQIQELKVGTRNVGDLDYSHERGLLAFEGSTAHGQGKSLYLLNLNNGKKEIVFTARRGKEPLYRPRFDPRGEYLYALNYFEGVRRYSFLKKTWEPVRVADISISPQGLAFSRTGQRVAISPGDFRGFLIAKVTTDKFLPEEHVLADFDSCISPQWIDEKTLIFAGRKEPGMQYLWKFDLGSKHLTQLTIPPIGARNFLSLSRDGKTIVFTGTGEKFEWRLWEVSVDGTGLRQLTTGGNLSSHLGPVWIE
jgi:hypothetical protein